MKNSRKPASLEQICKGIFYHITPLNKRICYAKPYSIFKCKYHGNIIEEEIMGKKKRFYQCKYKEDKDLSLVANIK